MYGLRQMIICISELIVPSKLFDFTMYITAGQQGCGDDMAVGQVATMGRKARDKATEN